MTTDDKLPDEVWAASTDDGTLRTLHFSEEEARGVYAGTTRTFTRYVRESRLASLEARVRALEGALRPFIDRPIRGYYVEQDFARAALNPGGAHG